MFLSYLVRLAPERLAHGELVGVVEDVDTGTRVGFDDVASLVAALRRRAGDGRTPPDRTRPVA